ncbi:MAG: hypothetical protein WC701_02800 [Kiritimatiellales bacterium]|jgi:hypothetical protein
MRISYQRFVIPGLAVLCGIAALSVIPSVHLPRQESGRSQDGVRAVPVLGLDSLNAAPPSMQEVVAKHLFIPERKATGQNSFADLVVKGVFLGAERSAVFSLKSKPQADLRVWAGGVAGALSQIKDPRDPRQPIAEFLREWNIKEISFSGVTMQHFITGEVETYAVNYTPEKKAKDDAARGYGQGIMPQGESAQSAAARTTNGNAPKTGQQPGGAPPVNFMADRVSAMLQRMSPDQKKQFMQRLGQNAPAANQKTGAAAKSGTAAKSGSQTGSKNTQNSKKTQSSKKTK